MGELDTYARFKLNILTVVVNNYCWYVHFGNTSYKNVIVVPYYDNLARPSYVDE